METPRSVSLAGQHTWQISRSFEKICKTADPGFPPLNWHEMLVGRDLLEVSVCDVFGVRERGDSLNPGDHSLRPCFAGTFLPSWANLIIVNLFQAIFAACSAIVFSRLLPCVSVPPKHCLSFEDTIIIVFTLPSWPRSTGPLFLYSFFFFSSYFFLQFPPLLIAKRV